MLWTASREELYRNLAGMRRSDFIFEFGGIFVFVSLLVESQREGYLPKRFGDANDAPLPLR